MTLAEFGLMVTAAGTLGVLAVVLLVEILRRRPA